MKTPRWIFLLCFFGMGIFPGCRRHSEPIQPQLNYAIQERYLQQLPSPFPPLNEEEKNSLWGKELLIGQKFAERLDLYPALTAFKRAEILIPSEIPSRRLETYYQMLLCYYVGQKYGEVIQTFESTPLRNVNTDFVACKDLLLILYDSYLKAHLPLKAEGIRQLLEDAYPETKGSLTLSDAFLRADIPELKQLSAEDPENLPLGKFVETYESQKKSVGRAKALNALVPGAGYLYVGQKQSAVTAFLLNGLFIAAACHFFDRGHLAAGAIFTSFEFGWYFGGINGAGLEAKYYNERLFEREASPVMTQEKLFPALMLSYGF